MPYLGNSKFVLIRGLKKSVFISGLKNPAGISAGKLKKALRE